MKAPIQTILLPKTSMLEQPQVSQLIRELRQLTAWTQEELAVALGVAYGTINRWENGRVQPSMLALKQIYAVLQDINQSAIQEVREQSQQLLEKYFAA
ncbi:helix-turn-helix transcriptional regulator [Leptolyngbya sp. FACHB-711]|uniref:helix-turn-helix domain-containing protein n=1 Tax=unclassified Leptolyngbya TaxID=2650499 RepID=UPI0016835045|nr:helix-turn-helix transcriptional regulator [Leptolyngbya sp. FACHB-711]MBD1852711.1 helix-turn-helix transcriptional regulator [Cyanobacteria bacterium FACHB-502]MBD2028045.1 helix-turn-helix transcriptional regulator [Leptolyngbya sp. FACHB-711]